ncbi:hypothetical protein V490_08639 [Pseudogymnoascus sp. VKM F-3557]|nr:hypothetical protein V490_08639 [Pseudogymnoascus sp. VKM F-3557]
MLCGEELRMPGYGAGKARSAGLRHKAWAACEKGVGHVVCRLACVGYNRPSDGGRLCGDYDGSSGSAMPNNRGRSISQHSWLSASAFAVPQQAVEAASCPALLVVLHALKVPPQAPESAASCSTRINTCTGTTAPNSDGSMLKQHRAQHGWVYALALPVPQQAIEAASCVAPLNVRDRFPSSVTSS